MGSVLETSARLLRLLSLLQTPRVWPGGELAGRLGVSPRTVRNDVERLRRLGYPVAATRGAAGGYRLGAGAALPPLLLEDDEAVAVVVGLRAAAGRAVEGLDEAARRALAKLTQVLPTRLRGRVSALSAATVPLADWSPPGVDAETLTTLAGAIARREALRFTYRPPGGREEQRRAEPHRLVSWGRRWYLVAFDDRRQDWRRFRVDRIAGLTQTGQRAPARALPEGGAAAFVARALNRPAPTYRAVATLNAPVEAVAGRLGDAAAELEPLDGGRCRLRSDADTLEWLAFRLATLGCAFEVHQPPELIAYLRALGARVARATAGAPDGPAAAGAAAGPGGPG